jgi:hypothetical protein
VTTLATEAWTRHRIGVRRETILAATLATAVASLLAWLGPPGSDLAAHVYQSAVFHDGGFQLWNNFWYAGRYSFVTYSVLYYPLASLVGLDVLAVASIAIAAAAFSVLIGRQWGPIARWSDRCFAVVWSGLILSGAFPFALGAALGLLGLCALQGGSRLRFAILAAASLAASPLAFLLLTVVLVGAAGSRGRQARDLLWVGAIVLAVGSIETLLLRLFPSDGRYPFSAAEFAAAVAFCVFGIALSHGVPSTRPLRWFYAAYLVACASAFAVPSGVGENIARLRFAAIPLCVLSLSLRRWRPWPVAAVALALAVSWNLTPLAGSAAHGAADPTSAPEFWTPTVSFLRRHLTPSYRVEVVDTTGHWAAAYLPEQGIPIARGWFRQSDFPRNATLYGRLGPVTYGHWLRDLGVLYVVLPSAPIDYSAREEAALLESGSSGLVIVFRSATTTIFRVPRPRAIVTGPGSPTIVSLDRTGYILDLPSAGTYRIATTWTPYWDSTSGCVTKDTAGLIQLSVPRRGRVRLTFDLDAKRALATLRGHPRGEGCLS